MYCEACWTDFYGTPPSPTREGLISVHVHEVLTYRDLRDAWREVGDDYETDHAAEGGASMDDNKDSEGRVASVGEEQNSSSTLEPTDSEGPGTDVACQLYLNQY